jgi:hypothetical protein
MKSVQDFYSRQLATEREKIKTLVEALELIRESNYTITTPKVLMYAHKKNINIAANAVAKMKGAK